LTLSVTAETTLEQFVQLIISQSSQDSAQSIRRARMMLQGTEIHTAQTKRTDQTVTTLQSVGVVANSTVRLVPPPSRSCTLL